MTESPSTLLGRIAGEFTDRRLRGECPSVAEYLARYPEAADLLREVLPLLVALPTPGASATPRDEPAAGHVPPPTIPGYEIVRELGRGGMGVVYEARQAALGRRVALKMVLAGAHAAPEALARFLAEAELAARLQHAGIVQVFDLGQYEGLPYLAMELVPGVTLAARLGGLPQPPRQAAELVRTLAEAVQHAHERGVVHRDLKPANVLLAADGASKIADFGLARRLEGDSGLTATGAVLGTPSYMAPEQAAGQSAGPAADVYALGAILYECLTGRPPFKAASTFDTLRLVLEAEPVPPGRLTPNVPRDLETICLTCLHKEARRRYATAAGLAADLGRFLDGRPVLARPAGPVRRAAKWARRRPALAALLAVSAVALTLVLGGGTYFTAALADQNEQLNDEVKRTKAAEQDAQGQKKEALWLAGAEAAARKAADAAHKLADQEKIAAQKERHQALAARHAVLMLNGQMAWERHDVALAEWHLSQADPGFQDTWEHRHLLSLCRRKARPLAGHDAPVNALAVTPDGKRAVSAGQDWKVRVWDVAAGKQLAVFTVDAVDTRGLAISRDGRRVAHGGMTKKIRVWEVDTGRELAALPVPGNALGVTCLAFNPAATQVAAGIQDKPAAKDKTARDRAVGIWDIGTGQLVKQYLGHQNTIYGVAYQAAGDHLYTWGGDATVRVWDTTTGQQKQILHGRAKSISGSAVFGDGKRVVSGGLDHLVRVWDMDAGREVMTMRGHTAPVSKVAVTDDGKRVVSLGRDNTVRVWDADTGQSLTVLLNNSLPFHDLAVTADGRRILTGNDRGEVRVWHPEARQEAAVLQATWPTGKGTSLAVSGDGRRVVMAEKDWLVGVWEPAGGQPARLLKGHTSDIFRVAVSRDGRRIVSSAGDRTIRVWNADTGLTDRTISGFKTYLTVLALSADGRRIASAGILEKELTVWDADTGALVHTLPCQDRILGVAFSGDGRRLATAGHDQAVRVWDAATGQELAVLRGHTKAVSRVAFAGDGRRVVSAGWDKTVRVWDADVGRELLNVPVQGKAASCLAVSGDGRRFVVGGEDHTLRVYDTDTGQEMAFLKGHTDAVVAVDFTADGRRIVSAGKDKDRTVRVWDADP